MFALANFSNERVARWALLLVLFVPAAHGQTNVPAGTDPVIEFVENRVEVLRAGARTWDRASADTNHNRLLPGDQLRTGDNSRAGLRLPRHKAALILDANSHFVVPVRPEPRSAFQLLKGRIFNFHRGPVDEQRFQTPTVSALVRGTDFALNVAPDGTTEASILAGEVSLENVFGQVEIRAGEQAIAKPGEAPRRTALIVTVDVIQWCLYYPAVLDVKDLPLSAAESERLGPSIIAYQEGDLYGALRALPEDWKNGSAAEQIYGAAVLLSVGSIDEARLALTPLSQLNETNGRLAQALERMIAVVKGENQRPASTARTNATPTELLVESYRRQLERDLPGALQAAREVVMEDEQFAFGWERVAELEFGFGRVRPAKAALDRALKLSPRNAQAVALLGFVLSAQNRIGAALEQFERAIELDGRLANGWLGRGLCRFRAGEREKGLEDLQMAAAVEPQRSLLRSYLAKGFGDTGNKKRAIEELELARNLDPMDPTPWLYSALILHDNYETARAIHELEKSRELNDNRAVYRSRFLLDQDQAVRSANLAAIFEDADMSQVALRESARAVAFDYGNFSAHLNLAGSFNQLRDPTRFNLRYETEWFNEHLLASLLAPVGAGSLSQNLSQQEYASLFAGKSLGFNSTTEYFSNGEWRQTASQFGTLGNTSYALDLDYQSKDGVRVNNDLERIEWYSRIKQQINPQDSLMVLVKYQDYEAGDNFQYYDPDASARPDFRFEQAQKPVLLAGWHHEWSPGVRTLFLGGRLVNDQRASDQDAGQTAVIINPLGGPTTVIPFDVDYDSDFTTYTAELNQIFQRPRHTDILGARYQNGTFEADASLDNPPPPQTPLFTLPEQSITDASFQRLSVYAYHHWEIIDHLMLIGGVAYDALDYPANYRRPPLDSNVSHKEQWSPKAALIWDLAECVRLRGVFTRAIGGVAYDESVRLEPTQLAGFSQSFRSLISESLVGSVEAPEYQTAGGAVDLRPGTNTWLSLQAQSLRQEVTHNFGIFELDLLPLPGAPVATPANTIENLDYHEWQAQAVLNQIIAREWFVELRYQFTRSELERGRPLIPAMTGFDRMITSRADLHQGELALTWRSPTGFFARGEVWWYAQALAGDGPQPPGDSFPQMNLYVGYRFPKRRGELTLGGLNLTGEDYRLSPLNYYLEMPRERVFYMRLRLNF